MGGLMQLMWSFLKFSLGWVLFGFCLSVWELFRLFLAIKRPSVKTTPFCAFLTGVTGTGTVPCAAGRWPGQEIPGWCQRPLQKMTLPLTSLTWWMRRGSPTGPDPAHQADHSTTTWSFCYTSPRRSSTACPFPLLWAAVSLRHSPEAQGIWASLCVCSSSLLNCSFSKIFGC